MGLATVVLPSQFHVVGEGGKLFVFPSGLATTLTCYILYFAF
jgi:hypothetical protein